MLFLYNYKIMSKVGQYAGKIHSTSVGPHKLTISNLNKQPSTQISEEIIIKKQPSIYEDLRNLIDLKYADGSLLFPINVKYNDILYEVINRIRKNGFDPISKILTSKIWNNEEDLYFSLPEYDSAVFKYNNFIEEQYDVREVISGLYKCKRCKSDKTTSFTVQLRSRDEGETVKINCTNCGLNYKLN